MLAVHHVTSYVYEAAVFLEPHVVRLRPRDDAAQRLTGFEMQVDPAPAGRSEGTDAWGNTVTWLWFDRTTPSLRIETRTRAELLRADPFDYILPAVESGRLPLVYADEDRAALAPFLGRPGRTVSRLAGELAAEHASLVPFLSALTGRIYERCETIVRPEGEAWPADRTLEAGRGSCRDLAVVFTEACRAQGIAARFVSGYQEGDPGQTERDLHAWAEAYVPGGGWRGYDPTHGLAVTTGHLAVAAAATPAGAAPVTGSFRGAAGRPLPDAEILLEVSAAD